MPRTVRTSTAVQAAAETPAAAPKQKSPSAYNLFIKERYSAEKAQNPDVDLKRMSQFWRELPEAEKAEYAPQQLSGVLAARCQMATLDLAP